MREPLPLYCETSAAYAAARPAEPRAARRATSGRPTDAGTRRTASREHLLVLGGQRAVRRPPRSPPRTPTRTAPGWAADETTRFGRYARRLWDGLLADEELDEPVTGSPAHFDVCGPLPSGVTRARGQRRDGQDVHHRRARRPLRRRGHAARAHAAGDVRPHGDRRAAGRVRERLVTAEHGLAPGARRRRRRRRTTRCSACSSTSRPTRSRCAAAASPPPWPTSTRPRSPPPTASASTSSAGSASPVTSRPTSPSSRTRRDLVDEVVDDLYVRRFREHVPPFDLAEARRIGTRRRRQPRRRAGAGRRRPGDVLGDAPRGWPMAVRGRGRAAQAAAEDPHLRRPADPAGVDAAGPGSGDRRPAPGCASATASRSSTSSRTPTRSSGTSCGGRSARATRRSC